MNESALVIYTDGSVQIIHLNDENLSITGEMEHVLHWPKKLKLYEFPVIYDAEYIREEDE